MNVRISAFMFTLHKRYWFAILIFISLTLSMASRSIMAEEGAENCATPSVGRWAEARPTKCLQDPGWFDVGAGIVVIENAAAPQQNAIGNMVTLRAYPFGRWYAPLKSLTSASSVQIETKLHVAQAATNKAADTKEKADKIAADQANSDAAQSMQTALNEFGSNYALAELEFWPQMVSRVSFFLGRSVGGFDTKVVDGDINAFGIAFDVAPEFAVVWGHAYFNQTGVANSSRSGNVIGVQINLKAFKVMRGLTGAM